MSTEPFEPSVELKQALRDISVPTLRRFINDEIATVAAGLHVHEGTRFDFLCECGTLTCSTRVSLSVREYNERAPRGPIVGHDDS